MNPTLEKMVSFVGYCKNLKIRMKKQKKSSQKKNN